MLPTGSFRLPDSIRVNMGKTVKGKWRIRRIPGPCRFSGFSFAGIAEGVNTAGTNVQRFALLAFKVLLF